MIFCRRRKAEGRCASQCVDHGNGLDAAPGQDADRRRQESGQGFEFLGYRFEAGRRFVRKKSLIAFKDKVRAKTGRSSRRQPRKDRRGPQSNTSRMVQLTSSTTVPSEFRLLDSFIRRRMRAILRRREKRRGFGLPVPTTINAGQTPTSQVSGCSR